VTPLWLPSSVTDAVHSAVPLLVTGTGLQLSSVLVSLAGFTTWTESVFLDFSWAPPSFWYSASRLWVVTRVGVKLTSVAQLASFEPKALSVQLAPCGKALASVVSAKVTVPPAKGRPLPWSAWSITVAEHGIVSRLATISRLLQLMRVSVLLGVMISSAPISTEGPCLRTSPSTSFNPVEASWAPSSRVGERAVS
jgi:hypothetical protein